MNFSEDMKQYGETAVEQGKAVAAEARKPLYALVGAGGLAVERVRGLADRVRQSDPNELREQVTTQVRHYLQTTGSQALTVYAGLTQRGEKLLDELRQQPVVRRVLISAEEAVDKVEDALEDLIANGRDKARSAGKKAEDEVGDEAADTAANADIVDAELVEDDVEAAATEAAATDAEGDSADTKPAAKTSTRTGPRKTAPKK